jgi:hypothetical protein
MEQLAEFTTNYTQKTKHRKKCSLCGRLIQDGELVRMRKFLNEKFYPVKGIKKFVVWRFSHETCESEERS